MIFRLMYKLNMDICIIQISLFEILFENELVTQLFTNFVLVYFAFYNNRRFSYKRIFCELDSYVLCSSIVDFSVSIPLTTV